MKNQMIRGRNTTFYLGNTTLTPRLQMALQVLDRDCYGGSGGYWDIFRIPGGWGASPSGPFDTVYWNGKKEAWIE